MEHAPGGFVPSLRRGPSSKILIVGDAPGYDEGIQGEPFVGAAGSMLTRVLKIIGHTREEYDFANVYSCVLPGGTSERQPWAYSARESCRYIQDALDTAPPVIVPLGGVALKRVLGLFGMKDISVEDFHGTVTPTADGRFVVPSFHPSYLQRGAVNLMGVAAFDLSIAHQVAASGWSADPGQLIVDPPVDWFAAWAEQYIAAALQDPYAYPLANDIETPDKGSDVGMKLGRDYDPSFRVERVNLSADPNLGITVPFEYPYIGTLQRVYAAAGVQALWYKGFDLPRLLHAGMSIDVSRCYDLMWMAKVLQSDLPSGLGFWAPFYSRWGAWKHLADTEPRRYAAIDALQTRRVCDGLVADLLAQGQWEVFARHQHRFHHVALQPATDVGVPIDRGALTVFRAKLDAEAVRLQDQIQSVVPEDLCPLTPAAGLRRLPVEGDRHAKARTTKRDGTAKKEPLDPLKVALYARATVVEKLVLREVTRCASCDALEVTKTHRCADRALLPVLVKEVRTVTRWFWREPLNPDSPPQLMAYLAAKQHAPGKSKHTGHDSVDRETLVRLWQKTGDPLYKGILDYRAVAKVRGTYVVGTERRLDDDDRVHPEFTFKPSTMRLSAVNPNITNVIADKGGTASLAAGFRLCVVARPRHRLWEFDYSGIEQVVMGWLMQRPEYIRIAKLGVHANLTSHILKRPADMAWSDTDLAAYFKSVKKAEPLVYDRAKRVVHGTAYGLTTYGMCRNFPETFPTLAAAEAIQRIYFTLAPSVPEFHRVVQHTAHLQRYLGGSAPYQYLPGELKVVGHPAKYKHWLFSVVSYDRLTESQRLWRVRRNLPIIDFNGIYYGVGLGEDAKRAIAFYPQSCARAILTEAMLALFDPEHPLASRCYIGDVEHGKTPLLAPIHDSILLSVPTGAEERVLAAVALAMQRPMVGELADFPCPAAWGIGPGLTIGVEAKCGENWAEMQSVTVPGLADLGVANDTTFFPAEDYDEDEARELETTWHAR